MMFWKNEQKYTENATKVDEAIDDLKGHGPPQYAWDQIDPEAAKQAQAQAEAVEEMRTTEKENLKANASLFQ